MTVPLKFPGWWMEINLNCKRDVESQLWGMGGVGDSGDVNLNCGVGGYGEVTLNGGVGGSGEFNLKCRRWGGEGAEV